LIGFIILCVWIALFIVLGILLIIFAKKLDALTEKFAPAYYKFLDRISLKLLHIETRYLELYNSHNIFYRLSLKTRGIKILGMLLILAALVFFIVAIWPKS